MATFQKINGMFEDETQRPQDQLLNPQAVGTGTQPATTNLASGANTSINAGAASNKALQGQSAAQYTQSQAPNAAAALVSKNAGKQAQVDLSSGVKKSVNEGEQKAQNEANAYATQNQNAYQGDMNADVQSAATNDESFNRLSKLVNTQGERVKDFQYSGPTQFDDVKNLTSTAGISNGLAQQNQSNGYTRGQSRLDALLLKNDKNFQNQAQDTQRSLQGLRDVVGTQSDRLNGAGGVLDKQFNDFQNMQSNAREAVGKQAASIKDSAAQRGSTLNAQNADVRNRYKSIQDEMVNDAKSKSGAYANDNPFLQQNLKGIEEAVQRIGMNGGTDASNFISEQDAVQFNRLQSLINGGDSLTAQGEAGSAGAIDEADYRNQLREALLGVKTQMPAVSVPNPNRTPVTSVEAAAKNGGLPGTNGNAGATGPIPGMKRPSANPMKVYDPFAALKKKIASAPVTQSVQSPITQVKRVEQQAKLPPSIQPTVPVNTVPAPSSLIDNILNSVGNKVDEGAKSLDPTNPNNWKKGRW